MHTRASDHGFTLVEVAVAMLLLMTVVVGLVPMMTMSVRAVRDARMRSLASALAAQKVEQLRALCWAFDDLVVRVSDAVTAVRREPFGNREAIASTFRSNAPRSISAQVGREGVTRTSPVSSRAERSAVEGSRGMTTASLARRDPSRARDDGFFTLMFFEEGNHRRSTLRYIWEAARGKERTWRGSVVRRPRVVSPFLSAVALAVGPVRYLQGGVADSRS
jgi:Tfp pilus assembly protein PilV